MSPPKAGLAGLAGLAGSVLDSSFAGAGATAALESAE